MSLRSNSNVYSYASNTDMDPSQSRQTQDASVPLYVSDAERHRRLRSALRLLHKQSGSTEQHSSNARRAQIAAAIVSRQPRLCPFPEATFKRVNISIPHPDRTTCRSFTIRLSFRSSIAGARTAARTDAMTPKARRTSEAHIYRVTELSDTRAYRTPFQKAPWMLI